MSRAVGLAIGFYRTAAGTEPVREWLLSLPADVRKEIGGDIRSVQEGWPLGKPYVDGFGDGLYEVRTSHRGNQFRVLFVIIEDCYAGVWGSYGNTVCKTPNVDRFARTALRFDSAYVQGIACNPSRSSFLSGLRRALC